MEITPDTKDWTWVLREPCPECGFDSQQPERDDLAALAIDVASLWLAALEAVPDARRRPQETVWSPLEYGCHVRDVFALASYRVNLMLTQDDPLFENWDQDATAVAEDYNAQDVAQVSTDLVDRAAGFAVALAAVAESDWSRPGRRSDGAPFTVESFSRYLLHDPIHHLTDVTGRRWA